MNNCDSVCCDDMKYYIQQGIVLYSDIFDEFGIMMSEDKISTIKIQYCPWCGKKLPMSQREKWFEELEQKGFKTPLFDENIPCEYKSKKWRKKH